MKSQHTLVMTLSLPIESRILYQTPILRTRCCTGLRCKRSNFVASSLISKMLFNNANKGASGNAATNIVTKPYCRTEKNW